MDRKAKPNSKNSRPSECCARDPNDKELSMETAGYDKLERSVLYIARCYWQTFAAPQPHAWMSALSHAERQFGGSAAFQILCVVQAMRISRVSCFRFNNPACAHCAGIISEHERQFMSIFSASRSARQAVAQTHAMILCEGQDTTPLLDQMEALIDALGARKAPAHH